MSEEAKEQIVKEQTDEAEEPPKKRFRTGRFRWPKLEITDPTGHTTHPFLSPTNWMDQAFIQLMLDKQPFSCKYGQLGPAWEKARDLLIKETLPIHAREDPADDGVIFPPNINVKTIKSRFSVIMNWMKKHNGKIPMKSGIADEVAPTQFIQNLLDLYEVFNGQNESDSEDDAEEWIAATKGPTEGNNNDTKTKTVTPSIHSTDSQKPNPLSRAISKLGDAILRTGAALDTSNLNSLCSEKFKMRVEQLSQDSSSKAFGLYNERIGEVDDEIKRILGNRHQK